MQLISYTLPMIIEAIFFDLDGTLYENRNGLWEAIRERMSIYMHERMGLPWAIIPDLRRTYYETYGTTLRGLQIHYQVDPDEYLEFVHDLPLDQYLEEDPELRAMLNKLPQRKHIFTNADSEHAKRVLNTLGVQDCFEAIIDVKAVQFQCKPDPAAYHMALKLANITNTNACLYLDDAINNLKPAQDMGFQTILVGDTQRYPAAKFNILNVKELVDVYPSLLS